MRTGCSNLETDGEESPARGSAVRCSLAEGNGEEMLALVIVVVVVVALALALVRWRDLITDHLGPVTPRGDAPWSTQQ